MGDKCDACAANYYGTPTVSCSPCVCTSPGTLSCDSLAGTCSCDASNGYDGVTCSDCLPNWWSDAGVCKGKMGSKFL